MVDFFPTFCLDVVWGIQIFQINIWLEQIQMGILSRFTIMEVGNGFTQDLFPLAPFEHFHDYGK